MPDIDSTQPLDDAYDRRTHAFVLAQGISELDYTELLELASTHAAAADSVLGAPAWRFVGPRNIGGRVVAIGQDPIDPRIIYSGSAHGGLWRSIDGADTWERLGEAEHVFPVGAIAVPDGAPNVVYFGTGALDPAYVSGRGIYRATITGTTGPATIERLVAPDNPTVAPGDATPGAALRYTRIRVDPDDPTRFWAASQTGLWRCECPLASPPVAHFTRDFPINGVSPDAAKLATAPTTRGLWPSYCTDLLVARDPRETDTVPLNGADVSRYLILFVAVDSAGVYRGRFDRKDGSVSFESSPLNIPWGDRQFTRIRLALCERQPQNVAVVAAQFRVAQASGAGSTLSPAVDSTGTVIPGQYHASNATGGAGPALTSFLRSGDNIVVTLNPVPPAPQPPTETQRVLAVLNDTDVVMATPFQAAFPAAGLLYARAVDANSATELFKSSDSGDHWTMGPQPMRAIGALTGQADYDLVLEIAPDDPDVVIGGEGEICLSRDRGQTWTKILDWEEYDQGDKAQHADQHIAMFDRGDHRRLWVGNDGGLSLARDLRLPVQADGYWRKRSHGIYAGESQDVSTNPTFNFMCGAGFQDNGTYLSLGGPTWYHIGGADGGAMAFDLSSTRQMFVTWQGIAGTRLGMEQSNAVASDAPLPGSDYDLVTIAGGDLPDSIARGHLIRYRWTDLTTGFADDSSFVGVVEHHPTLPGNLLAGRLNDAYVSTNFGANWTQLIAGTKLAPAAKDEVSSVAFGPVDAHTPGGNVEGWAGTGTGTLFFSNNAIAGPWAQLPNQLPFPGPALRITEIFAHPRDRRMVLVSATGLHGRVFLTYDQGRTWIDISEPTPTTLTITPAAAVSVGVGQTVPLTAIATYGTTTVNVTWKANWSANPPAQATVISSSGGFVSLKGFGKEGQVTGVAAGNPNLQALLLKNPGVVPATKAITVTAAAQPVVPTPTPPREMVPGSLPPGPVSSVIFDPSIAIGAAATILAGTLMGVYALQSVPVIQSLAIQPAGALTFQTGAAAFQLRCVATFSDGTQLDVTRDVDWSTNAAGTANVSNAAGTEGQLTFGAAGPATISADRAGVPTATAALNVQAGAAALPVLPAAPAATAPPITVEWKRFNENLPQVLVTDFTQVTGTNAIRASTFGLGVFECVMTGAPLQQTHIRQTIIEDGRAYPRAIPATVPDDPRLPANAVALDMTHAFDIRVDAPPYSFFDEVVDPVEMDEQIEVSDAVPSEANYVYVQVHNIGTSAIGNVTVHLYAAECDPGDVVSPIGPVATASPASLEVAGAAPIADFYGQTNRDPIATSKWKRIDAARLIETIGSDAPQVVRFTWTPDVTQAGKNIALLALADPSSLTVDALPPAPAGATLAAFILAERRAALRVVHVATRAAASLYVRDGVADDARVGGYPFAGRSPDIMVVNPDIAGTPEDAFKDFMARRPGDKILGTGTNVVYVRVHNRHRFETKAKVKVFAVGLNDLGAPNPVLAAWVELPAGAAFAETTVPPLGVGYARVEFPSAGDPNITGTLKTYLLVAVIKSDDETDPLPNRDSVDSPDAFWDLVSKYVDSDNVAARAVAWSAS